MTDHSKQLPEPIREAKRVLDHQKRYITVMMSGIAATIVGVLVAAGAEGPKAFVLFGVIGMITWGIGNIALMTRHADNWKRAADLMKEWDRRQLAEQLDGASQAEEAQASEPNDPRWRNLQTLLGRIRDLADDDPHLVQVTGDVERKLRGLLEDQSTLAAAIAADRALGGDSEATGARARRLQQALDARSATADRLVEAIRDLHVELAVRDASTDPLVDRLEALLSQVEAEAEVASVGTETERAEKVRLARASQAARQRE